VSVRSTEPVQYQLVARTFGHSDEVFFFSSRVGGKTAAGGRRESRGKGWEGGEGWKIPENQEEEDQYWIKIIFRLGSGGEFFLKNFSDT
jgi:hypothetical protein